MKSLANFFTSLLHSRLARQLAMFGSSTGLAQLLMIVYALLVARHLGPENYGVFAAAYSLTGLTAFFINWGMDTWLLREAATSGNPRRLAGAVLKTKVFLGLIWGMVIVVLVPLFRADLFPMALMFVCAVDVLSDSLFNTQTTSLNVMGRIPQISVMLLISRGGRLLGAVVLIFAGEQAPLWFAVARAAATLTASAAAALLLSPQFKNPEERFLHIWRQSLPYGLSEFLALVYGQADITLLALLLGQFSVGLYAPASGIITAMTGVLASGFYIIVPILSRQLKAAPQRFSKTARLMFAGYALVGGLLWITFLIGSPAIVQLLLGSAYNQTGELMVILSIILFLKSLSFACAAFLVAVGWQHRRLAPQLVSAVVNVVLNLWAIPNLGIIGVAWVFVASEVVLLAGYSMMTIAWLRSNPRQDTLN